MSYRIPKISYGILSYKPTTRILILGPYRPPAAKARLLRLRDHLRSEDYSLASLLDDQSFRFRKRIRGETLGSHFWAKSCSFTQNWAEIALYVLICGANNLGVMSEFNFMQYNVKPLLRTSTVFVDENCPFPSLTTQGNITASGVNQREFSTDDGLYNAASAECRIHLRTLY